MLDYVNEQKQRKSGQSDSLHTGFITTTSGRRREFRRTDIVKYNTDSEKSMQKWEYKILKFSIIQELPPENYLNQLGEQGWKISASGGMARNSGGHGWIILMREKI